MNSRGLTGRGEIVGADWLRGACRIAEDVYPGTSFSAIERQLDRLAQPLVGQGLAGLSPPRQAQEVNQVLYGLGGFRGNECDYDDPRNSYINLVLERRLGIPITLALVYSEVAKRAGLTALGVGFPGHFLVKLQDERCVAGVNRSVLLDPFSEGAVLTDEDLAALAERTTNNPEFDQTWLRPSSDKSALVRMLANLRASHQRRGDLPRLLLVLERLCELQPDSASVLRDRGLVTAKLGAPRAALADFERYVALVPDASDVEEIKGIQATLHARLSASRASLN